MPVGAGKRREDCYCSSAVLFCPGPGPFFPEIVPLPVSTPLRLKSSDTSPSPFLFVPRAKGDSEGNRGRGREGGGVEGAVTNLHLQRDRQTTLGRKGKEEKRKGEEGEKLKPSFRHFSFFSFSVSHENCFLHRLGKGGKGGDDVGAPKGFLTLFEIGRTSEEMASGQLSGKSGVRALAKKGGGRG